jgi:hypothetical protein
MSGRKPVRIYNVSPYKGPLTESPYWTALNAIFGGQLAEAIPGLRDVQLEVRPFGARSERAYGVYYPLSKQMIIYMDAIQRALEQGLSQVPQEVLTHETVHAGDFIRNLILEEQADQDQAAQLAWNIIMNMGLLRGAPTLPRGEETRAYLLGLLGGAVPRPASIAELWNTIGELMSEPFVVEVRVRV